MITDFPTLVDYQNLFIAAQWLRLICLADLAKSLQFINLSTLSIIIFYVFML